MKKNPPSCPDALQNFKKAAEKAGFYMEFITKDDSASFLNLMPFSSGKRPM
jgi:hypothetical protein